MQRSASQRDLSAPVGATRPPLPTPATSSGLNHANSHRRSQSLATPLPTHGAYGSSLSGNGLLTRSSSLGSLHSLNSAVQQAWSSVSSKTWRWAIFACLLVAAFFSVSKGLSPTGAASGPAAPLTVGRVLADTSGSMVQPMLTRKVGEPLGVCIMTSDFWGLHAAGGTATAYHLLAYVLGSLKDELQVTMVGVYRDQEECTAAAPTNSRHGVQFECLQHKHFQPEVVETHPYEKLSHAVVAWVDENLDRCDVIHTHEWGGVFTDLATLVNFRQLKPGLRHVVEPHGGHFWSTQGQIRPLDITSLRIDQQERMTLQLASTLISPTHYMTAYLRQRGWKLPKDRLVIPNVLPNQDTAAASVQVKQVWRLVFFSRLEERKGIKLFVEAVSRLGAGPLDKRFEVVFMGAEARIDMQPSGEWLQQATSSWTWPVSIKVNADRDSALDSLSAPGTLLVLCSLVDNMPYVVAEAALKGLPFVVFDQGGVMEMIDNKGMAGNVILEPTADALYTKLSGVLAEGRIQTVRLTEAVSSGRSSWLQWHRRMAGGAYAAGQQADIELARQAMEQRTAQLEIQYLNRSHPAMDLFRAVCVHDPGALHSMGADALEEDAILIMPAGYELLDHDQAHQLSDLLQVGHLLQNSIGALSFGTKLPNGKFAYATGPTWTLYSGDDHEICEDNIPVLIRRSTFCDAFVAEARTFRIYTSWLLSMYLSQLGLRMHTFPRPAVKLTEWSYTNVSCPPDKPPQRDVPFSAMSNLLDNAEEIMVNFHLAPYPRPDASFVSDAPKEQHHKGWQVGFMQPHSRELIPLTFDSVQDRWQCPQESVAFPVLHKSLAHPCSSGGTACCGVPAANFVLRWESFLRVDQGSLILAYEAWPICGDGLDLELRISSPGKASNASKVIMQQSFEPDSGAKPQRHRLNLPLDLHPGDVVDFVTLARENHDCDGVYLIDVQVWQGESKSGAQGADPAQSQRRRLLLQEEAAQWRP